MAAVESTVNASATPSATSAAPCSAQPSEKKVAPKRLASIDALRGFSMFLLVCVGPVVSVLRHDSPLKDFFAADWGASIARWFSHCTWEGFVLWDLIMPLFVFTAGLSIPFQFAKYRTPEGEANYFRIYLRIFRRVLLLWIFGMIAQGNLLHLKWEGLRLFSNTLQTIAVGYLFASILYLHFRVRIQALAFVGLLLAYWAAMAFVSTGDFGGGSYAPETNLCEWVDQTMLGKWRDGVAFNSDGSWSFSDHYRYTWLLSSLTFIATTLSGVLAGELIRRNPLVANDAEKLENTENTQNTENAKRNATLNHDVLPSPRVGLQGGQVFLRLLGLGILLLLTGWGWAKIPEGCFGYCPMIKIIWTPSMVLFSSGWSLILLAAFYGIIDVLKFKRWAFLLTVLGTNSIAAYLLPRFVDFSQIARKNLFGMEQFLGNWYPLFIAVSGVALLWAFLAFLYRTRTFIRL